MVFTAFKNLGSSPGNIIFGISNAEEYKDQLQINSNKQETTGHATTVGNVRNVGNGHLRTIHNRSGVEVNTAVVEANIEPTVVEHQVPVAAGF